MQTEYTQQDVLRLKNLRVLRETGMPLGRVGTFCENLNRRLGGVVDPLMEMRFEKKGKKLAVRWQGTEMDAQSGQLLLELAPAEWKAIATFPKQTAAAAAEQQKRKAASLFQQALEKENAGARPDEVIPLYLKTLELDEKCFGAHVNLGTIYFNQKRLRLAEQHYRKAIDLHPKYVLAHFNLASLYDEQGKFEKAAESYRKTLELDPQYVDAHYNLALLLQNLGRTMEATRHWTAFLRLDPRSEWSQIARRELKRLLESTVVPNTRSQRPNRSAGGPLPQAQ